jgi:hypothetical protein
VVVKELITSEKNSHHPALMNVITGTNKCHHPAQEMSSPSANIVVTRRQYMSSPGANICHHPAPIYVITRRKESSPSLSG